MDTPDGVKAMEKIVDCSRSLANKIEWKLVPVKIVYFFFALGIFSLYPFVTLQAREIGLSFGDISIVVGVIPVAAALSNPIIGFFGDKLGYKPMVLLSLLGVGLSGTLFDITPRYKEYSRYPTAELELDRVNTKNFILRSISWPATYPKCDIRKTNNNETCQNFPPLNNDTFYNDLINYLKCSDENGEELAIENLDTAYFQKTPKNISNLLDIPGNGTFCYLNSEMANVSIIQCNIDIVGNPYLGECVNTEGSHAAMFWTYLPLRALWQIFMSATFALLDGTSMCLVKKYNGSYAMIIVWQSIAGVIGPLLAGLLVQDSEDPDVEANYQNVFYFTDGMLGLTLLVVWFALDCEVEKTKDSFITSFKKILNPAFAVFLLIGFAMGIEIGVGGNYVIVYLQEELGATSTMIGIASSITALSGLLVAPFAKRLIQWTGEVNMLFVGIILSHLRLFLYSIITWSPPYHYYIIQASAFVEYPLPWIASIQYGYKVAPPSLVATTISTIGSVQYILGAGVGGFVGGQLVDSAGFSLPLLFQVTAAFSVAWAILSYLIYKLFCKKYENKLIQAKDVEERQIDNTFALDTKLDYNLSPNVIMEKSGLELRKRNNMTERALKTKSQVDFEDSIRYWSSQTAGKTTF